MMVCISRGTAKRWRVPNHPLGPSLWGVPVPRLQCQDLSNCYDGQVAGSSSDLGWNRLMDFILMGDNYYILDS